MTGPRSARSAAGTLSVDEVDRRRTWKSTINSVTAPETSIPHQAG